MTTPATEHPLAAVRVLEFATQIAWPYAGKLFVDAGADVIKVEPEGGDPFAAFPCVATPRETERCFGT